MSDGGPGCVVLCSGTYFDGAKKMADFHLATALAERVPVLFVDPPTSHLTPLQNPELVGVLRRPRLRRAGERLHHLTPLAFPKPHARGVVDVTRLQAGRQVRGALNRLGLAPHAVVSTWQLIDAFDFCPGAARIYWWLDDPGSAADLWGFDRARLVAGDHQMRRRADLVLAVSEEVVDEVRRAGGRAEFFPNGCDAETMARTDTEPLSPAVHLVPPIAGFVGHLNSRTDLGLLEAVANAGISLLLVGPHVEEFEAGRFRSLCLLPNVCWVGPQPFERLPAFQGHLAVGLVPYADTEFNRASFPLKPLEYLAAGRPVVSTSLPGVRWLDSPDVTFADNPFAFTRAVASATRLPLDRASIDRRRSFAQDHSWPARADELLRLLELLVEAK